MARGIHAEKIPSAPLPGANGTILPLYIGGAPYWQTEDANWQARAGQVFLVSSLSQFISAVGYIEPESGMWPKAYSLCEAAAAHFKGSNPIGPIIILTNATQLTASAAETTASVALTGLKGSIPVSGKAILSSFQVDNATRGVEYSVVYDITGQNVIFTDLTGEMTSPVSVKYKTVVIPDPLTMGEETFTEVDLIGQKVNRYPSVIAAPGWEREVVGGSTKTVGQMLESIAQGQINQHWHTQAVVQLYADDYSAVLTEKASSGITSAQARLLWPLASKEGKVFTAVTKLLAAKMRVDLANGNVPFESASNKALDVEYPCDKTGERIFLNNQQSDKLNENGVTTLKYANGTWRTWGVCMSNYLDSAKDDIPAAELNDVSVQMQDYICNDFQERFINVIDKPITVRRAKAIVDDYKVRLNGLVADGALLYGDITFSAENNSVESIVAGDFVFDIATTTTPPGKSILARVRYVYDGINNLVAALEGGAENGNS